MNGNPPNNANEDNGNVNGAAAAAEAAVEAAAEAAADGAAPPIRFNQFVNKNRAISSVLNTSILATYIPAIIRLYNRRVYSPNSVIKFFTPLVTFLLLSIFIETSNIAVTVYAGVTTDVEDANHQRYLHFLANVSVFLSVCSTLVSIVISSLAEFAELPLNVTMTVAPTSTPIMVNVTRF